MELVYWFRSFKAHKKNLILKLKKNTVYKNYTQKGYNPFYSNTIKNRINRVYQSRHTLKTEPNNPLMDQPALFKSGTMAGNVSRFESNSTVTPFRLAFSAASTSAYIGSSSPFWFVSVYGGGAIVSSL